MQAASSSTNAVKTNASANETVRQRNARRKAETLRWINKRTNCEGCNESFSHKSFKRHTEDNFDESSRTYKCAKKRQDSSDDSDCGIEANIENSPELVDNNDSDSSAEEAANLTAQQALDFQRRFDHRGNLNESDLRNFFDLPATGDTESLPSEDDADIGDENGFMDDPEIEDFLEDEAGEQGIAVEPDDPSVFAATVLRWLCLFIAQWQTANAVSDTAIGNLLLFLSSLLFVLASKCAFLEPVASRFPKTIGKLHSFLGFKTNSFKKFIVCPSCFKLYQEEDCYFTNRGVRYPSKCNHIAFPNHRARHLRRQCGTELMKQTVTPGGKKLLVPYKVYCYKSLKESIETLYKRPYFERMCQMWKQRRVPNNTYEDIYDGRVWKEFLWFFEESPTNIGVMLNLDWFNPYKHSNYSVGVLYMVCLNLPRTERFKRKNVILIGIIPNMKHEPSTNTFIEPLVGELKEGWNDGFSVSNGSGNTQDTQIICKIVLLCVGCDIPACRKLCGFLGHSATQGCSKCKKSFPGGIGEKVYGGFDRDTWEKRTDEKHREEMREIQQCRSKGDKEELERKYGTRYSALIELPYFSSVRMSVIDPMHNLFLGTAKHVFNLWKNENVIDNKKLEEIDEKLQGIQAASDVGKLPTKLITAFNKFTADEFKNWTLLFSIYALKDTIRDQHLECWRKFVLACRYLCSKVITESDIQIADGLLMEFCKSFERLYGVERVTPNMHLHGHLSECLKEYGPVYSFWLFSFERYNGHLGSLPTNKRQIEKQIMNRFLRDGCCHDASFPAEYREDFSDALNRLSDSKDRGTLVEMGYQTLFSQLQFTSRSFVLQTGNWSDLSQITYPASQRHLVLTDLEKTHLLAMYKVLYPDPCVNVHISYSSIQHIYANGDIYGSCYSRSKRSSTIMAFWAGTDGEIQSVTDPFTKPRPGVIEKFLLHVANVNGEPKQHLVAKVSWFTAVPNYKNYFGKPHEVWYSQLHDMPGPASFIPIQRIRSKFVKIQRRLFNKDIIITCPRDQAISI